MNWKIKFTIFLCLSLFTLAIFLPPWRWYDLVILGNLCWIDQAKRVWIEKENYTVF